jgi:Na+-driven multidrug efflux pump
VIAFAFQGLGRATLPLVVTVARIAAVLTAAIVCTRTFGLGERAVFTAIAIGNVGGTLLLGALFLATQRGSASAARDAT